MHSNFFTIPKTFCQSPPIVIFVILGAQVLLSLDGVALGGSTTAALGAQHLTLKLFCRLPACLLLEEYFFVPLALAQTGLFFLVPEECPPLKVLSLFRHTARADCLKSVVELVLEPSRVSSVFFFFFFFF